jgi:uncharacterized alkaline shock family protein YloU
MLAIIKDPVCFMRGRRLSSGFQVGQGGKQARFRKLFALRSPGRACLGLALRGRPHIHAVVEESRGTGVDRGPSVDEQRHRPLWSERGGTRIEDAVVAKIAGIAAQEVEGIQMGGGTARAVGGFLDSVTGGGGQARGVAVEVGEEEAAIDLSVAVEYGKPIPQISEAVRRSVIDRVENLIGLRVIEVNITVNDVLLPEERPLLDQQREVQQQAREQERRA